MKLVTTLVIVHTNDTVLLGMKKRGFGTGLWNGFGGKVLAGESIESSAIRELVEEAHIAPKAIVKRGDLYFTFAETDLEIEVHVFTTSEFDGQPTESEEMRPQWFAHSDVPYDLMWKDDRHWLPHVLAGKRVQGRFHFNNPDEQIILEQLVETYE